MLREIYNYRQENIDTNRNFSLNYTNVRLKDFYWN